MVRMHRSGVRAADEKLAVLGLQSAACTPRYEFSQVCHLCASQTVHMFVHLHAGIVGAAMCMIFRQALSVAFGSDLCSK